MRYDSLHETVIRDVLDTIKDGIQTANDITGITSAPRSVSKAGSLSKATSGLTLVFPVFCSKANPIDTSSMCAKFVEAKAVSLLQIAFTAFDICNSKDAVDFVKNFHTNLGNKVGLDDFIDAMEVFANEHASVYTGETRRMINEALADLRNIYTTFGDDINESSLTDYKIHNRYGRETIIEARSAGIDRERLDFQIQQHHDNMERDERNYRYTRGRDQVRDRYNARRDAVKDANDREKMDFEREKHRDSMARDDRRDQYTRDRDARKDAIDTLDVMVKAVNSDRDAIKNMLLSTDIKKANESAPTMMMVNFFTPDKTTGNVIQHQLVIGVKAKIYGVESEDVLNKIVTKNVDSNMFMKLVKVSTREISFVKDFLFAIDNAKLTALGNSRNGSQTNKMLKLLERRALKGKVRKALSMNNQYKAISTLVLTREEVNLIKTYNDVDLLNVKVARKIMEDLNFMMFIITDESSESVELLMDTGDDTFETISYTNLERGATDGSYKKAINLMTKVVR